jgi:glycosyltransferase involved in cell wall biosynthesis
MKISSVLNASTPREATTTLSPIRICMHVLGPARTDARVMREAIALRNAGFAVSIVDIECGNKHSFEVFDDINLQHIRVTQAFMTTRFARWTLLRAVQILLRSTIHLVQTPADIYQAHDVSGLLPCYIAARLRRKPLIFDSHEIPLSYMSIQSRTILALLSFLLMHILPRCAGVITVSQQIAQEMRMRYRLPEVSLVRNVPMYRVVPRSDRLRQRLELSPGTRIALYQGYLQPVRSLDRLVRAARYLEPGIVIVLMGQNQGSTQAQLEALIASEGVSERVKILPHVPYEELLDWTASADIGLVVFSPDSSLSIRWCLPNKLFEYLMVGLPVLSSELDAVVEVIKTYKVGKVVTSLRPADIATSINAMLADSVTLAEMRRNALDVVQQEFHWEKECQRLIQLYHNVLVTRS